MIADAAASGARLVVLTEMFSTGFSMDDRAHRRAGRRPERAVPRRAGARARRVGVRLGARARSRATTRPSNRLVLAGPDGALHRYARSTRSRYGGEHEHYAAGDELVTVDVEGVRVSLFVCYDLRFADEFWALAPRHRLLRRRRELAGGAPRPLAHAAAARGRSRTRPTSSASTASGAAAGSTTRATARSCGRSAARWKRPAGSTRRSSSTT